MYAQALICSETQAFTLEEVVLPAPEADQVLIRTHYSGVSIGTEFALIRGKLSWGPYPLCTGYMGTGIVEQVGEDVREPAVDDRVYFRRGTESMNLRDGRPVSCVAGAHCSHAVVRPHSTYGVARLPAGADMETASMFVMPAVGLYGVDMANPRMGQNVVVYGTGLIGLGVVAACNHRGCVVIAVDINEKHLEVARSMGADHTVNGAKSNVVQEVRAIAPDGADVVFECTGLPECLDPAIELCRRHGSFVWQGNYGDAPVTMKFRPAHARRLRMFFPCDDGLQPCRRAVVKNMSRGTLRWEQTITHRILPQEAPAMFDTINRGADPDILGVVIHWAEEEAKK